MVRAYPKSLNWTGIVLVPLNLLLATRLVWEQTVWTWERGPQMVGFSLMHSSLALLAILALIGGMVWIVAIVIFAIRSRSLGGRLAVSLVIGYGLAALLVEAPYGFWQRMVVERLAQGPHAAQFVVYAAAGGELQTVQAFLSNGTSANATMDDDGGTPLHAAAVNGHINVIEYLLSQGADINALNEDGETPVGRARNAKQEAAASFLVAHGGKEILGSEEYRQRVNEALIRMQMEKSKRELGDDDT